MPITIEKHTKYFENIENPSKIRLELKTPSNIKRSDSLGEIRWNNYEASQRIYLFCNALKDYYDFFLFWNNQNSLKPIYE